MQYSSGSRVGSWCGASGAMGHARRALVQDGQYHRPVGWNPTQVITKGVLAKLDANMNADYVQENVVTYSGAQTDAVVVKPLHRAARLIAGDHLSNKPTSAVAEALRRLLVRRFRVRTRTRTLRGVCGD